MCVCMYMWMMWAFRSYQHIRITCLFIALTNYLPIFIRVGFNTYPYNVSLLQTLLSYHTETHPESMLHFSFIQPYAWKYAIIFLPCFNVFRVTEREEILYIFWISLSHISFSMVMLDCLILFVFLLFVLFVAIVL